MDKKDISLGIVTMLLLVSVGFNVEQSGIASFEVADYKTFTISELQDCQKINTTICEGKCIKEINNINGSKTCSEYDPCYKKTYDISFDCKKIGYNVSYEKGQGYIIKGECCYLYNQSFYKLNKDKPTIVCTEKLNGMCRKSIQQTSKDVNEFDEYGIIYTIEETEIIKKEVGVYEYTKYVKPNVSQIE